MSKQMIRFFGSLFDGYFLGRAATYAFMQEWKSAYIYTVVGLVLTGIDLISMVRDHKGESEEN